MDQQKIVETVGNLMGIVTALEVQTNALLLTSIGAGVDPNVILRAIEAVPKPHRAPAARPTSKSWPRSGAGLMRPPSSTSPLKTPAGDKSHAEAQDGR